MAKISIKDTVALPVAGTKIPRLGLGVYRAHGTKCSKAVKAAIKAGYRHVDSADFYGNEADVGDGVLDSGVPREEIFVTTKHMNPDGDVESTYRKLKNSVDKIGLDYVDLFLIHWPGSGKEGRKTLWAALERLHADGLAKAIGVSNYGVHHLEEMKEYAKVYPPAVNQIELHPWFQQKDIVDYCNKNGIPIEAYSPLLRQEKADDPTLGKIAKSYSKSPNQILVRYSLQKGWIPLPKSEDPGRIKENADIYDFEISEKDMQTLDALDQGRKGAITWTPQFDP